MEKEKIGLIVGRFQPFHEGHLKLIRLAIKENDKVIIGVGQPNKGDLFSQNKNYERVRAILNKLNELGKINKNRCNVIKVKNVSNKSKWPAYLHKKCGLNKNKICFLYKADKNITREHIEELKKQGIYVCFVKRKKFLFVDNNGRRYKVSSASEIRRLCNP